MQHQRHPEYLPLGPYTRQRTAIFSTVTGRRNAVVVASSGPDFTRPERLGFQLLTTNEPAPQYGFTPLSVPFYPRRADGQMSAGYRYGEVQPWWFSGDRLEANAQTGACISCPSHVMRLTAALERLSHAVTPRSVHKGAQLLV